MISSYYYIKYTTIELFAASVAAKTKVKGTLLLFIHLIRYDHTGFLSRGDGDPFLLF